MSRPTLHDRLAAQPGTRSRSRQLPGVAAEQDFSSADSLGLARHFQVIGALADTCAREGLLGDGLHPHQHRMLEESLCEWLGFPAARSFQSLGQARLALQLAVVTDEQDLALHDHLNGIALTDATHLAGCRLRRYPHGDAAGAAWQLRQSPRNLAAIITEGIFSADGQLAPLAALASVAAENAASLLLDDPLGIGSCGDEGRGAIALTGLATQEVDGLVVSLEHALGLQGAVVLGSEALLARIDAICLQRELPRPANAVSAAALVAVQLARRDQWRRDRLAELGRHLHQQLRLLDLIDTPLPPGPLHTLEVEGDARQWQQALLRRNLKVTTQTVHRGDGQSATRISLHLGTAHDPAQLSVLADAIAMLRQGIRMQVPLVPQEA